jgi:2-polyprenyl-3-methyl-5-hydroxy-6-metoxy-1,4-benzoquinol methylase
MKHRNLLIEILFHPLKEKNILLGPQLSYEYIHDAKHLCFSLSRYKFVSKILEGTDKVLEIGAGDGFKSKIVSQTVKNLTLSDYTDNYIKNNNINAKTNAQRYIVHNFEEKKLNKRFSAIYALDVLEHINKKNEHKFITNILHSLNKNGILIFGCPSIESQKYASSISKLGHINCKNKYELKNQMLKYFNFCFPFSMNDEVLHTGFDKLSHYILVVCCGKKN